MKTYSIRQAVRHDPNNPDNSYNNIDMKTHVVEGTITKARKEAYRLSREENTIQVSVRYDGHEIGYMAGIDGPGNENVWMVTDYTQPLGRRAQAIDASGRVKDIWRA